MDSNCADTQNISLSVIIPLYNEVENIGSSVRKRYTMRLRIITANGK